MTTGGPSPAWVDAVNALGVRWAAELPPGADAVFCAPGVWVLLALLSSVASGDAENELVEAAGVLDGAPAAAELVGLLRSIPGVSAAMGLWTRSDVRLLDSFLRTAAPDTLGILADPDPQAALDAWVAEQTNGQLERLPVTIDEATRLVLASALAMEFTWREPFTELHLVSVAPRPISGDPWVSSESLRLRRSSVLDHDQVRLSDDVCLVSVTGESGVDVVLLLGRPGATAVEVLTTGLASIHDGGGIDAADLPSGEPIAGVTIRRERSSRPEDRLMLTTVAFSISAETDLLSIADVFGLRAATDASRGHFPGLADEPLMITAAAQSAVAEFGALGYRAASATAFATRAGGRAPQPQHDVCITDVTIDRPFGFAAVHRDSGVVLMAGWVHDSPKQPVTAGRRA